MDNITSQGLPFIVQCLLDGQCAKTDTMLEYKISCSGKATQLTLTWTTVTKNSMSTQACSVKTTGKPPTGYKKKTPSDKKRDSIRKQQFIEKKKKEKVSSSKVREDIISKPDKVDVKSTGPITRSKVKLTEGNHSPSIASVDTPELKRGFASDSGSDNIFNSPGRIETGTRRLNTTWNSDLESQPPWSVRSKENQATGLLEHEEINSSTSEHMDSDDNNDDNEYDSCGSEDPYDSLLGKLKRLEVCFNDHFAKT